MEEVDSGRKPMKETEWIFNEDEVQKNGLFPFCKFQDGNEMVGAFGVVLHKWENVPYKNKKTGEEYFVKEQIKKGVLIGSNHTLYTINNSFKNDFGIDIQVPDLHNYPQRWSLNSIKQFLNKTVEHVNGKKLLEDIKKQYKKYMYFYDERWYDVHALWDIGTYFFLLFKYYPIFEQRGIKASAKTKCMTISRSISFNASEEMTNPSAPTLFRETQEYRPTTYIDEAENLFKKEKGVLVPDERVELINSGYRYTGSVPRQEKFGNRWKTVHFSTYSPKMISSIIGLEGATEDRSIIRITTRAKKDDKRSNMEPEETDEIWQDIRDRCYVFALQNWAKIQRKYSKTHSLLHCFDPLLHSSKMENRREHELNEGNEGNLNRNKKTLKSREFWLWKPLLVLADLINKDKYEELLGFAEECGKLKSINEIPEGSMEFKCMMYLVEIIKTDFNSIEGETIVLAKDIIDKWQGEYKPGSKKVLRILDGYGLLAFKDRFTHGVGYRLNQKVLCNVILSSFPSLASLLRGYDNKSKQKLNEDEVHINEEEQEINEEEVFDSSQDEILTQILRLDKGEGAEELELIKMISSSGNGYNELIEKMIEEGVIFRIRPGILKVLK